MQVDKTTLNDLSIFEREEELSIFHYLCFTRTNQGKDYLRYLLSNPLGSIEAITDTQKTIQHLQTSFAKWPASITNGTIMVVEKFYDSPVTSYPNQPSIANSFLYKLFNSYDFSLTKYSVEHFITFIKSMELLIEVLQQSQSKQLQTWVSKIEFLLGKPFVKQMLQKDKKTKLLPSQILAFGNFLRNNYKHEVFELIDIYSKLDAYLSLATACTKYNFCFPQLQTSTQPFITAQGLYHILLPTPISYDVQLNKENNFLFLTGANMAGKSTFIKAVGVSVYLAHIGMGVPAKQMQISLFDGLLSNIHVVDNIVKGESYFFNEVQRIKSTVEKISDGKNWLILIDELFKGTNVQDAMKCSTTVIEGLRKMNNALFILSTHLYEIAEDLKKYDNIQFRYFETSVVDDQLVFNYQLQEGISNDRLGYLILKKEGVVSLLEKL